MITNKLRVARALTDFLKLITIDNGYDFTLTGVYRGRNRFGTETLTPFLSILEAPRADVSQWGDDAQTVSKDNWTLLIQGFATDDAENPTDPAYQLLGDVEQHLSKLTATKGNGMGGGMYPEYYRLGGLIAGIELEQPVVRPPEEQLSSTAFFYLPVRITLIRDIKCP
jgi:hypothetical protein